MNNSPTITARLLLVFCLVGLLGLGACSEDVSLSSDGDSQTDGDAPTDGDSETDADAALDGDTDADGDTDGEMDADPDAEPEAEPVDPTYWSAEATVSVDDLNFVKVNGEKLFAIGFHGSRGLIYDGVSGPGECDSETGEGFLPADTNIQKTTAAWEAGANFIYMWGFKPELVNETQRFYGDFHSGYGVDRPIEEDIIPVIYNRFGEVELDGYSDDKALEMEQEFEAFINREGPYSPENMPNLPPVEDVGHMSWHPTFRMIGTGDGSGEMLTSEQADRLAKSTNMMIGDTYTYVENRYDMSIPEEYAIGILSGQKGDKGENYESWLESDDPEHRSYFDSGFDLADSLTTRRQPDAVVWMWLQGYSFGDGVAKSMCLGRADDAWAVGGFPPLWYMKKQITGMLATGVTGLVYFGFPNNRWPETEIILNVFRSLSHADIYQPVLLSPRLDLGYDTLFMGEEGHDGKGRVHLIVKWHDESKHAFVVGANPGARATDVDLEFPWSVAAVEVFDWETQSWGAAEAVTIRDKTLHIAFARDSGDIWRVTPMFEDAAR